MRRLREALGRFLGASVALGHARLPFQPFAAKDPGATRSDDPAGLARTLDREAMSLRRRRVYVLAGGSLLAAGFGIAWALWHAAWSLPAAVFVALGAILLEGSERRSLDMVLLTQHLVADLAGRERALALTVVRRALGDGGVKGPLSTSPDTCPPDLARRLGEEALQQGQSVRAAAFLEKALEGGGPSTRLRERGTLLLQLAMAHIDMSALEAAAEELRDAKTSFDVADDPVGSAHCERGLGEIALRRGKLNEAQIVFVRARALYEECGEEYGADCCAVRLASIASLLRNHDEAEGMLREAAGRFDRRGDGAAAAAAWLGLADALHANRKTEEARAIFLRAARAMEKVGDVQNLAEALRGLGDAQVERGDLDEAEASYQRALELFVAPDVQNVHGESDCLRGLARVAELRGRHGAAKRLASAATAGYEGIGMVEAPGAERKDP